MSAGVSAIGGCSSCSGGYFCYVGRPNPKMEIVLQHSSKKAFTLLDIASFINNQG